MRTSLGNYIDEYKSKDKGQNYPVYSVTNSQGFCQEFFGKNVASADTSNYKVVPRGCFAYNPSRINVGSVACQDKEDFVSVSPLYVVFKVSPELNNAFLMYYLKSNYCMTYIKALSRGAVRNNLHLKTLKTFEIPKYDLKKQEEIVSELDLLSSIIEKKKLQLEKLEQLIHSIFYKMFNEKVAKEKGWEEAKLRDVLSITSPMVSPEIEPYNKLLHVGPANIVSNTGEIINCKTAKEEQLISGKYAFSKGMILYSKIRPNLNKVAIAYFDGICSADMYPLTVNKKVNTIFMWRVLLGDEFLRYATNCSGRARMPKINREALFEFELKLPPISLQQQFAEKIKHIESLKSKINNSLKEVETLFKARMDYWFN